MTVNLASERTLDRMPRRQRRLAAAGALAGYPLFLAAWVGLPALGVHPIVWVAAVGLIGVALLLIGYALYQFRQGLAQADDGELDERQLQVRDRAYRESYRLFVGLVLVTLLVAGIGSDVLDAPISLGFDVMQPLIWGAIFYALVLPSAVVAWREPDLEDAGA